MTELAARPKRAFAQHFLESSWIDRIVAIVKPLQDDIFLEIGAGRGELTLALARSGARIVAVEIDHDLVRILKRVSPSNVTIVSGDFLEVDLFRPPYRGNGPLRVVGNLPYSVSSMILLKLLRFSGCGSRLSDAILMFQREVADRVTAEPKSPDWGPLAVLTRLHAHPVRILTIPPGAFRPMPRVRSAVVTLKFRPSPVKVSDQELFDLVVRRMFTQRRKMAVNALRSLASQICSLSSQELFEKAGVDPRSRPGQLELAEFAELSKVLALSRL